MKAVAKVKETVIRDFLFADDYAPNTSTEQMTQNEMDCLGTVQSDGATRIAKASVTFGRLRGCLVQNQPHQ